MIVYVLRTLFDMPFWREVVDMSAIARIKNEQPIYDLDSPWIDDCLGRKALAPYLTNIVKDADGPLVIAVNGTWGSGKSYFLNNWCLDVQRCHKWANGISPVIYFNAWESDFCHSPLLAIIGQLYLHFEKIPKWIKSQKAAKLKDKRPTAANAKTLMAIVTQVSNCAKHCTGIDSEQFYSDIGRNGPKLVKAYKKESEEREKLIGFLRQLGDYVARAYNHPLVVIVDELDRCRPSFAVETLERIKHIFSVPHTVFVLGIDRQQLGETIQSIYGNIDVNRYLQRFIDVDFGFPEVDTRAFIDSLMQKYNIYEFFADATDMVQNNFSCFNQVYHSLCQFHNLALRDIETSIKLFTCVIRTYDKKSPMHPYLLAMMIVLKLKNLDLYDAYVRRAATANELIGFFIPSHISPEQASSYLQMVPPVVYATMQYSGDNQPLQDLEQWRYIRGSNADAKLQDAPKFIAELSNSRMTTVITKAQELIEGRNGFAKHNADTVKELAKRLACFPI